MSNTALSSARRRRAIPATGVPPQGAATSVQQAQMQRAMELQMQRQRLLQQQQQQQQQQQPPLPSTSPLPIPPYTQRGAPPQTAAPTPMSALSNPAQRPTAPLQNHQLQHQHQHQQQHQQHFQIVKADTVVPPGYVKLLNPNGVYHMESVETGSINFPYGEPHLSPTIILRNHDLDIIRLQGYHNDVSNQIAHLTTMVSRSSGSGMTPTGTLGVVEAARAASNALGSISEHDAISGDMEDEQDEHEIIIDDAVIHKITESHAFIASTVEHIMQNTNLSELVSEVDILKSENRDLRSILKSQQEMMNGMNTLLFTLLNKMHSSCDSGTGTDSTMTVDENCGTDESGASLEAPGRVDTEASSESEPSVTVAGSNEIRVSAGEHTDEVEVTLEVAVEITPEVAADDVAVEVTPEVAADVAVKVAAEPVDPAENQVN
jgi:hypothetical protein